MKSFAQEQGVEIIDWYGQLNAKNPDWERLNHYANSWDTCSIGQLSYLIERDDEEPVDERLKEIGEAFTKAVEENDAEIALIWLRRAKEREKEILTELKKKLRSDLTELNKYLK